MATIVDDPNGRRRIQFMDGTKRKTIRLGKIDRKSAENIERHVENLLTAKNNGQPLRKETAAWLGGVGDVLRKKLVKVGLLDAGPQTILLGAFVEEYTKLKSHEVKKGTMDVINQAKRWLLKFFGNDKPITSITTADADRYKAYLSEGRVRLNGEARGRSKATVNKWCRYAREFFRVAVRQEIIEKNPFDHIKGSVASNQARRKFVPADDVLKVIDQAPDSQWKLLIALGRFAGLRIPSEALALTWADINWEQSQMIVRASKTEHHADGGIRIVPIFPEVRPFLEAVWEAAPEGTTHVISKFRDTNINLRTQLSRYIVAAGLTPWPKLWQNLRASRATELADEFPSHVCAAWLGHTERIADTFYRSVTDEHFAKAVSQKSGAKSGVNAAQNRAQRDTVGNRGESQELMEGVVFSAVVLDAAKSDESLRTGMMGTTGFEPVTPCV